MEPKRSVVCVQHTAVEGPGLAGEALERAGVRMQPVHAWRGEPVPRQVADASGVLVLGGPMGVSDAGRLPYLRDVMRLMEDALARDRPVLGVCLGSQLLAGVLGAAVRRAPRREIGWLDVELSAQGLGDPVLGAAGPRIVPLHWHADVFDVPAGAGVLASSAMTDAQAFRAGHALGILFHMEPTAAIARGMTEEFAAELAEEGIAARDVAGAAPRRVDALRPAAAGVFGAWAEALPATGPNR